MRAVQIVTLVIVLAVVLGLFMFISWNNALAVQDIGDTGNENGLAAGFLAKASPFLLGVGIVAIVGILLWIVSEKIGE